MRRVSEFIAALENRSVPMQVSYRQDEAVQGYCASLLSSGCRVTAGNPLAAALGACRSLVAWQTRSVEWFTDHKPLYPKRLLFLDGEVEVSFQEACSLALPRFFAEASALDELEARLIALCRHTIYLGFNGIVWGNFSDKDLPNKAIEQDKLAMIARVVTDFGLTLVAMTRRPITAAYSLALWHCWPSCHTVLYQSSHAALAPNTTRLETIVEEAQAAVYALEGRELLFYVPHRALDDSQGWRPGLWSRLCDELPPHTTLVFKASVSEAAYNSASQHPFWHELRRSPDVSATPLLPLVNGGAIGLGQGLWPLLLDPYLENIVSQCRRHPFAGVIALTKSVPHPQSIAHSNLWVMGQRMWSPALPAHELMALWFECHRPDIDYRQAAPLLAEASQLALDIAQQLQVLDAGHEQWRSFLESSFARLRWLAQAPWHSCQRSNTSLPTLQDYFWPFYADIRRKLFHQLLTHHVSLAPTIEEQDLMPSFWTSINALPGQSVRAGADITLHSIPRSDHLSPPSQAIFSHSCGFHPPPTR